MNSHIRKVHPPPRAFSVKIVLLCCLLLIPFLAVPVQSQTATPTAPARMTNPTSMAACGLPVSWAQFTSAATVTTFNMTADCVFNSWSVLDNLAFLYFTAGEFTINGNGHSIIGPPNGWTLYVQNSGTTLNLNNVTIRGGGGLNNTVAAAASATLNVSNVIFRNNTPQLAIVTVGGGSQAALENVQFLNNRRTISGALVDVSGSGSSMVITNGAFRRNAASASVLNANDGGTMRLEGCMVFDSNTQLDDSTALTNQATTGAGSTITDNSSQASCPKRKKKEVPTATPTATPRPAYAASYTALQTDTGMTFEATYGLDSGVHFRQLDGAGIGVQSIIDAGPLAALDVYGYVDQGVEVCFPQIGRVIFLDARTMPRAIVPLESTIVNGQTCVSINSPGSLVLLPN